MLLLPDFSAEFASIGFSLYNKLCNQLQPCLSLSLHQENNALREHFVVDQLLLLEFEVVCPLQIVVSFVEVLLLDFDLGDFIEG